MTVKTIRVLMNSTMGNNGTVIRCEDVGTGTSITETTLIVYGKSQYTLLINLCSLNQ